MNNQKKKNNILDLDHKEVREYFLDQDKYFNFDLPEYLNFSKILKQISTKLENKELSEFYSTYNSKNEKGEKVIKKNNPSFFDNVNYKIFNNKNGEYDWRRFQLVHPALYVELVNKITKNKNWNDITKRFKFFFKNSCVSCASLPVVDDEKLKNKEKQILSWVNNFEKKSILFSMEYKYIFEADITAYYGSIYTHSIAWAMHGKDKMKIFKNRKNRKLIGVVLDQAMQSMSHGQTNGIPEGSILMDFISEILLGYIDVKLSKKLSKIKPKKEFKIIRYRDDYRIFVNNPEIGKKITKELAGVLGSLGLKLSTSKTKYSEDIILGSIKSEKIDWIKNFSSVKNNRFSFSFGNMILSIKEKKSYFEELLLLKIFSNKNKNSGILLTKLSDFYNRIQKDKNKKDVLISINIITDIAFNNPRTYPISFAILSSFISKLNKKEQIQVIKKIKIKFEKLPNTESLDLWLQRITLKIDKKFKFDSVLCKKVVDINELVWNSEWLNNDLKKILDKAEIIDKEKFKKMDLIIPKNIVSLFNTKNNYEN